MNVTGNQVAAVLATIVPLVASIFAQQSERQERNKVRAAEEKSRIETKRAADVAVDSASASQLNDVLKKLANDPAKPAVNGELCSTLHTSLELARQSDPIPKTEAVLAAWLTYRAEKQEKRLVCQCQTSIRIASQAWARVGGAANRRPVPPELLFALNAANEECNGNAEPAAGEIAPGGLPMTGDDVLDLDSPEPGARIYMQVPDDAAKKALVPMSQALRNAGYRVHETEIVRDRAPRCAELRYVYSNDTPEATKLLEDLNENLERVYGGAASPGQHFTAKRMSRYEGRSLNRVYELWLPANGGQGCRT